VSGKIQLAPGLVLPSDAVTQTFAFLARKGAGKTYGACKLAEQMHGIGAQIVGLDPVGVWWGLRVAPDGKSKGISIPVFGGLNGDVPLDAAAGAMMADLIVDRGISCILDVSQFRKGDRKRFATEFAEQLFHRKKSARTPLHLFVEEAQVFVPQRVAPDEARMLGAFEDIVKLGRNFGIGVTLISQRPQAVNKDALSQTECLIALQMNGALERKAIREWIVEQGLDRDALVDALPGLTKGEAFVWSPSWLRKTVRVKIGKRETFDASATPELGKQKAVAPLQLLPTDLDMLRAAMKTVVERAAADDPKVLRARIKELEARAPAVAPVSAPQMVEVMVVSQQQLDEARNLGERAQHAIDLFAASSKALVERISSLVLAGTSGVDGKTASRLGNILRNNPRQISTPKEASPVSTTWSSPLPGGEHKVLTAVAQHRDGVTREQLTVLTGYKRSSRDSYLQRLGARGALRFEGSQIFCATPELLGPTFEPLPTGAALLKHWLTELPAGEREILSLLATNYPDSVARDQLSVWTTYKRSSRDSYLQRLGARSLVEEGSTRGSVRASPMLFENRR
jgi:hypothetical protein